MTVTRAPQHTLSDAALTALGAGRAGPEIIAELRRAQYSRHLLLLREIAARAGVGHLADLQAADRSFPSRVREKLADPLFGVWAAACLAALRAGSSPEQAGVGHLRELAALARVPRPRGDEPPALTATHAGLTMRVRLESRDPMRARLGLTPAEPLDAAATARWQRALDEAWRLLVTHVRPEAETLAAVVTCLVPVRPDPAARGISATSADAFGAVAISEPADPVALAVGLLHEAQHSILNAVLYLFDLLERPAERGYSPWRDDPRPASGVLHGAYAYLTVTRFWRTRAGADELAAFEFARWRAAVAAAVEGLHDLTPAGARFVGALLDEVHPWLAEPVAPRSARLAAGANRDHYLRWRLRNRRVEPADAEALARAWRRGAAPPPVTSRLVPAPRRALEASARLDLAHAVLRGEEPRGDEGDVAYVSGDTAAALTSYRRKCDWAGMILAGGLRTEPELAAAAHAALDHGPDPLAIARWLS